MAQAAHPSRTGRLLRAVGLGSGVIAAALVGLQTEPGCDWLAGVVQQGVQGVLAEGWTLDRPRLRWRLDGKLILEDVAIRGPDQQVAIGVRRLDLELMPTALTSRTLRITKARLEGVRVAMTTDAEQVLNLVRAFGGPSEADPDAAPYAGLPLEIRVDDLALRDGMVSLWGHAEDGGEPGGFAAKVLHLSGSVLMPRNTTEVRASDVDLDGVLLHPGPTGLQLDGTVVWTGEGVLVDHTKLVADGSELDIHGYVRDLWGVGRVDAKVTVASLDLSLVDHLFGAGTSGTYEGELLAEGSLAGLRLGGGLMGTGATRGGLSFGAGSVVCLPMGVAGPDACGEEGDEVGTDAPLRWSANLGIDGFHLEDVLPVVGGPLRLEGQLVARGGGTTWPDGVWAEGGRYLADDVDVFGVPIRHADLGISLSGGVLRFTDLDLAGVMGTVGGGGSLDLTDGAMDLRLRGALRPEMLADLGVTDLGGRGTYTARVTGRVYDEGTPIGLAGTVDMSPVTWADGVVVDHAWGRFEGDVVRGIVDVEASLEAEGVATYGAAMPRVQVPQLSVHVEESAVTLHGEAVAELVTYGDGVRVEEVRAGFDVVRTEEGHLAVDADAVVGAQDLYGLLGNHGTVMVGLRDDALRIDTNLRWDDTPFIVAPNLRMDLASMTLDLDGLLFQPTMRQVWTLARPLHLRLVDGGVADADVAIASSLGRLSVKGTLGTTGALAGSIQAEGFELDTLAEMFPEMAGGLAGRLDLDVTALGPARQPNIVLKVDAQDLFWEDRFRYLDVTGQVGIVQDVATVRALASVVDEPLVRLDGYLPVNSNLADPGLSSSGDANLHVVIEAGSMERAARAIPGLEVPEGVVSGVLRVSGDLHDPDLDLQAVTEVVVPGLADRLRAELDLRRTLGALSVSLDAFEGYEPVVLAEGTAETRLGEVMTWLLDGGPEPDFTDPSFFADALDVHARLHQVPLGSLVELAGQDLDLTGTLAGDVRVQGRPRAPQLDVDLVAHAVAGGQPADIRLGLHPEDPGYHLDLALGDASSTWLDVVGRMPFRVDLAQSVGDWGTSTFDLTVGGEGLPLSLARVVDRGVRQAEGRVRLDGALGGTWRDPAPDLALHVEDGRLQYLPLGISLRDLTAELVAQASGSGVSAGAVTLVLKELSAIPRPLSGSLDRLTALGESRVRAQGQVQLEGWGPTDVAGSVHLTDAWLIALDDFLARVSGKLDMSGTWPELRFTGALGVNQGKFELNTTDLLASRTMQVDPLIRIHRGEVSSQRVVDETPSWLEAVQAWVTVDLGRNTNMLLRAPLFDDLGAFAANITRADIDARLGGELQVGMQDGKVSVVGDVETLSGRVDVLRGKFDLVQGSRISFLGEDYANPQLDITGAMTVAGGQIGLRLQGQASEPTFQFTSDDFGSDAAVFTILLTGRAPDELSADQGRSAIEAVSDLLLNSVLGGVSLGSVSVESDGTVTVGLPVYRTVFLETAYTPAPRLNENSVRVEAEWSILPRLLLNASYGDRLVSGNVYYELRLTSVCDQLRRAYGDLGGDRGVIDASCGEMRRALKARAAEEAARGTSPGPAQPDEDPVATEPDATTEP